MAGSTFVRPLIYIFESVSETKVITLFTLVGSEIDVAEAPFITE